TSRWIRFFFQAEDGIRDDLVTGVQTCALPISQQQTGDDRKIEVDIAAVDRNVAGQPAEKWDSQTEEEDQPDQHDEATDDDEQLQIGRASCRERAEGGGVGVGVSRKRRVVWSDQ